MESKFGCLRPLPNTRLSYVAVCNSSIRDGYIPPLWKSANICPLPKKNPPKQIEKDIRPISLTSLIAKELERFVATWLRIEQKATADPLQYGNKKHVSTTHMLVNLVHKWSKALDEGNTVNAVFIDFTKAFDKIDHHIRRRASKPLPDQVVSRFFASSPTGSQNRQHYFPTPTPKWCCAPGCNSWSRSIPNGDQGYESMCAHLQVC